MFKRIHNEEQQLKREKAKLVRSISNANGFNTTAITSKRADAVGLVISKAYLRRSNARSAVRAVFQSSSLASLRRDAIGVA